MKNTRYCVCALIMLLVAAVPAFAQISYQSEANHKQEKKRLLKEAKKADAEYKDTHLNPNAFTFKKGKAARKAAVEENNGTYTYKDTKPKKVKTRKNKKKGSLFKKKFN